MDREKKSARGPRPPRFGARNLAADSPARQEGARFAAAPHAGRFARRAQACVVAEALGRGRGERANASEFHPEPSRGRRRRDGGARKASPRRRPHHAASAAGPWPKSGGGHPPSRVSGEGHLQRRAAPRLKLLGRPRTRGEGRGRGGRGNAAHGGKRGQWGAARNGGKGLRAFTSDSSWHTRGQR